MWIGGAFMVVGFTVAVAWTVVPVERVFAASSDVERVSETRVVRGAGTLNVRSGPGTRYQRIESLANGTAVQVTGRVDGSRWLRIVLPDGREAWAHSDYLGAVTAAQTATRAPRAIDWPRALGEPAEESPTTKGSGTHKDDWVPIRLSPDAMRIIRPATPSSSFDVVPTDLVRYVTTPSSVRLGPGTMYGRAGMLAAGTQVDVTGEVADTDWLRIALPGGKTAFIFRSLVTENAPAAPEPEATVGIFLERPKDGDIFRDCADCPEMVVVPPGEFVMGSPEGEVGPHRIDVPRHRVRIGYSLAVGRFEVTFAEWDVCLSAGGCGGHSPDDESWGRGRRPVINVSWDDAQAYVEWLSGETGEHYRLLSEAEWEYVARAGTQTPFHFGETIGTDQANYNGNDTYGPGGRKGEYRRKTVPVGSFPSNAFGLHDVHGNVSEWVQDCWHGDYDGAPSDGSAWTRGCDEGNLVLRNGSWGGNPRFLRSAHRLRNAAHYRNTLSGFRVARTL